METPENVSWLAIVLAVAIVVCLLLAYHISMMKESIREDLYVRIIRSEYVSSPPFSIVRGSLYFKLPDRHTDQLVKGLGGGYIIDLRIGNMADKPLTELEFMPIGFGHGKVFLTNGENLTSGYHLDMPIQPKGDLELSLFIPSDYIPSRKVLLIKGLLEDSRMVSKSVDVP